jgi:hypothetical protein
MLSCCFEVKKLLNLRLDPDVAPTSFIADFKECLLRLDKNKAKISEDTDTLRALLLVAIQDDQFEMVRDSIVHEPTRNVSGARDVNADERWSPWIDRRWIICCTPHWI